LGEIKEVNYLFL